jgi:hypothetical protein
VCSFTFEGLGFAKTNDTERRDAGMNGLARQCTVSCSTSVPALKPDISLAKADDLAHRLKPPLSLLAQEANQVVVEEHVWRPLSSTSR